MTTGDVKKAAVLGWPVSQSLSPRLHGYWLRQYGINGSYEAIAVEPNALKQTLRDLADKGYAGVNLTLPHKEEALRLVDETDDTARRIGAINTIVMEGGKLRGTNTDAYGFVENLKNHDVILTRCRALVLGAGGAARAVCAGLLGEGADVMVANRTPEKALRLAESQGGSIIAIDWEECTRAMAEITLLVNTTPLGMKSTAEFPLSLATLPPGAAVADIVYNPLMTPLLTAAKARGHSIIDGLGMLLYQARPGFKAWFGVMPEVSQALHEYVLEGMQEA